MLMPTTIALMFYHMLNNLSDSYLCYMSWETWLESYLRKNVTHVQSLLLQSQFGSCDYNCQDRRLDIKLRLRKTDLMRSLLSRGMPYWWLLGVMRSLLSRGLPYWWLLGEMRSLLSRGLPYWWLLGVMRSLLAGGLPYWWLLGEHKILFQLCLLK